MTTCTEVVTSSDSYKDIMPRTTKINYGIGDFGNNIIWHTMGIWLAYFYTDVYGLSASHVAVMYLMLRIFDAITDPLVGLLVDRTRTKHGSCRPFILYGTIPLAITFIMLFYTPDLGETGKLVYAYVSFSLLTLAYTLVNVPFSAMAGFLTRDSDERTMLQSFRFGLGMLASVFVSYSTLSLVGLFGQGNDQQGFFYTAVVFALLIVGCLYYCFFTVKEVYPAPALKNDEKMGLKDLIGSIKEAFNNQQLVILFLGNILFFIILTLKATPTVYYVKEVLIDAEHMMTTFITWGTVGATLGAALSGLMWTRFDKVRAYKILMFVCGVLTAIPYWLPGDAFSSILILGTVVSFLSLSMVPLIWSMLSDVVDYQVTLTGKNMSGLFFALFLFTLKVGLGVGGALALWIMGETGYVANIAQQTPEVVESINFISTLLPGILFIVAGMIMMFYTLDKEKRAEIKLKLYGE
ncbi:glycoside-pentoside-hexuronide (GPH):cation symporter [Thalassotalea nanhaiensis]|uniref:Glycoside-pentoside-hexuronide (GPH):cation symporter n=1 Tax=Thalassotalea nanhaiensis TaxID=3065648 RepID=A0ABY9TJ97_9GAMM|nr:glycoside-pentoside-hexuronide (GPH):cation symporter [Colwelliaceae bacterium SQ345]